VQRGKKYKERSREYKGLGAGCWVLENLRRKMQWAGD